jgi:hypothetical protein
MAEHAYTNRGREKYSVMRDIYEVLRDNTSMTGNRHTTQQTKSNKENRGMSRKQEKAKQREAERERKQKRIENKKQEDDAEWIKQHSTLTCHVTWWVTYTAYVSSSLHWFFALTCYM